MTDLDTLNALLASSPRVRQVLRAYLTKAYRRGLAKSERVLKGLKQVADLNGHGAETIQRLELTADEVEAAVCDHMTRLHKADFDESKHPRDDEGKFAESPHVHIRAGLDKAGIEHSHLSDEELHAAISAAVKKKKEPAKIPDLTPDEQLHDAAVRAMIEKDTTHPGLTLPHEIDAVLDPIKDWPKEKLFAFTKRITGKGGRSVQNSLDLLRTDMTAVSRLLESQKV